MRLYRGLKGPYRPDEVRSRVKGKGNGTDFTDCPFTALSYAGGRKGVVLVLDVPDDVGPSVTEETWFVDAAKRLMVWGTFDRWLAAAIPVPRQNRIRRAGGDDDRRQPARNRAESDRAPHARHRPPVPVVAGLAPRRIWLWRTLPSAGNS
jgi:hypothetical protein